MWRGTAISSVVTPVFYLLAFGFGLGRLVDRTTDLPDGITYLEFVAPGLLAATAMQIATFEGSWPVLSAIKWSRQYHAMLATPLRVVDVLAGHQAFIAFRMVMTSSVYLAAIAAFGAVNSPLGILAIPVTVLVGIAFAAPIAAWGAYTQTDQSFVAIFRFGILPMFLFSGTFFPIERLPGVLEVVAYADAALARRRPLPAAHARRRRPGERVRAPRLPARLRLARARRRVLLVPAEAASSR